MCAIGLQCDSMSGRLVMAAQQGGVYDLRPLAHMLSMRLFKRMMLS